MPGQPKFTRTVAVSVEVNPFVVTVKDWNRDFEKGDLSEWEAVDAEVEVDEPYEGDYCCRLTDTGASITQTLDDPIPVNAISEFSCWLKRKEDTDDLTLRMIHTDGTTADASGTPVTGEWERAYFPRSEMSPDKILSGIALISADGDFFVDKVVLAIAAELITGAVEVTQSKAESLQAELRPRPKGGILETGKKDTVVGWDTIASHEVTDGKDFQLSKVVVSVEYATWIKYRWAGADISCERLMDEKTILLEHFPWDYEDMEGGDARAFDVQAKWYEEEGIINVEIVGEEV